MSFLSLLIGALLLCSSCFSAARSLERESDENFIDYVCRVKQLDLDVEDKQACLKFIQDDTAVQTEYLKTLHALFEEQLALRMGSAMHSVSREFLDRKIHNLVKIFLKDKLDLHKVVHPEYELAQRAKWDPHFHASSLFADYFPKARLCLPNFQEAYDYIKIEHRKLSDRISYIKQSMEQKGFATITEAGVGNSTWDIEHAGKKIIPIYAHMRGAGAVVRDDVPGYDMCGLEDEDRYRSQKAFFESVKGDKIVRMHVGETIIPAQGKENVRLMLGEAEQYYASAKPLRIGHGTHIAIEDMIRCAKKGYYIEACLSSNKRTGILDKRSDYPLGVMLLLDVPVVIGTDGGRLYSTTLAEEYAHAKHNLRKFHAKLKSSDDLVVLPNGDTLCFKHILPFVKEKKRKEAMQRCEERVTYKELKVFLEAGALKRISVDTLITHAQDLFQKCYPEYFAARARQN